ncbi:MAG TPA: hypothetical protein VGO59_10120 [Verrucomicrobiae bacterium]
MLLPALSHAKVQAQGIKCLSGMKQLQLAAILYADDNSGNWMPNQPEGDGGGQEDWVTVEMDWGGTTYNGGPVSTNWQLLITPPGATTQYYSFFQPYIKDPFIYKCPTDPSTINGAPRVRSYAASQAVGTCFAKVDAGPPTCVYGYAGGPVTGQWLSGANSDCQNYGYCYQKLSQMIRPSPSYLFVFGEEHPDSINDAGFAVQIASIGLGGDWIDLPSNLHNGGGPFSFADGHAETHKWVGSLISHLKFINGPSGNDAAVEPVTGGVVTSIADQRDLNWIQTRTSAPMNKNIPFPYPQ